jgi:hypothetical protein
MTVSFKSFTARLPVAASEPNLSSLGWNRSRPGSDSRKQPGWLALLRRSLAHMKHR